MYQFFKFLLVWTLTVLISIILYGRLIFTYIVNLTSMPWKPKDRILMETPICLTIPKYGTHKYVIINKIRFHYVESGDRSKPLILFIHGIPDFWYSWRHQIPEFSSEYWVVALDLQGFNLSDKPRGVHNYKMDKLIEDIKAFIEVLNRKKVILICHGFIGWEFVARYENMIYKYVMLGNPPLEVYSRLTLSTMDQFKKSWRFFVFKMPSLPEKLLTVCDFSAFSEIWTKDDLETYKYVFSRPGAITAAINYFRANFSFVGHPRTLKTDGSNFCSGMFIMGQRDKYISHAACIVMANEYPQLRIEVIPNANHFVHQNASVTANALIRSFLGPVSKYDEKNDSIETT